MPHAAHFLPPPHSDDVGVAVVEAGAAAEAGAEAEAEAEAGAVAGAAAVAGFTRVFLLGGGADEDEAAGGSSILCLDSNVWQNFHMCFVCYRRLSQQAFCVGTAPAGLGIHGSGAGIVRGRGSNRCEHPGLWRNRTWVCLQRGGVLLSTPFAVVSVASRRPLLIAFPRLYRETCHGTNSRHHPLARRKTPNKNTFL